MPTYRTPPQWYTVRKPAVVTHLQDIGELAVRLGSPISFDRRGDVVWYDSFAEGIGAWETTGVGWTGTVKVTTDRFRTGGYSAELSVPIATDDFASLAHFQPIPQLGRLGVEFFMAKSATFKVWELTFRVWDGSTLHKYGIRYDLDATKFEYVDENGAWSDLITGVTMRQNDYLFHAYKLVIDLSTDKYVRFLYNNVETNISTKQCQTQASTVAPYTETWLKSYGNGAAAHTDYVDDVILTQNEP